MCGICGFLFSDMSFDAYDRILNRMALSVVNRGPDDMGI